jgi:hypothetical protein
VIERIDRLLLTLPDVSVRLSHGHPAYFRGKRQFAFYINGHHRDPHEVVWCAAPDGMQQALVEGEPEHYFRPPYVGHRGWVGVRLDTGLAWDNVAGALEDAYDCAG